MKYRECLSSPGLHGQGLGLGCGFPVQDIGSRAKYRFFTSAQLLLSDYPGKVSFLPGGCGIVTSVYKEVVNETYLVIDLYFCVPTPRG